MRTVKYHVAIGYPMEKCPRGDVKFKYFNTRSSYV
jgi:hypothetical protein